MTLLPESIWYLTPIPHAGKSQDGEGAGSSGEGEGSSVKDGGENNQANFTSFASAETTIVGSYLLSMLDDLCCRI